MYFNFEDNRPDTPTIVSPLSTREGVLLSIVVHLLTVIAILVGPELPFMKAMEERRLQAIEEQRRKMLEEQRNNARFVYVQPRIDMKAPKPPERAELSDIDREARTVERAKNPTNPLPFSRGNSPERIEGDAAEKPQPEAADSAKPAAPQPGDNASNGIPLPESPDAQRPRATENGRNAPLRSPSSGVIADAIRNVQKYIQKEGFGNLQGGNNQAFSESIQFDTKGVEFGPWLRRFVAQIRRNWFIPEAAMTLRGHVVITFFVHKDGRITDLQVVKPSAIDGFNNSSFNALAASNPTQPLPPEYPDDKAFFTVTFYYNETPRTP